MTEILERKFIAQIHFKCLLGSHLLTSSWLREIILLTQSERMGKSTPSQERGSWEETFEKWPNLLFTLADFFFIILLILGIGHNVISIRNVLFIMKCQN